jgi:DNA-binding XRE family transcriptional regulator
MRCESRGDRETSFDLGFGFRLRQAREKAGFSQTELGEKVGAHRNTIHRWEQGMGGVTLWMFLRICCALKVGQLQMVPPDAWNLHAEIETLQSEREAPLSQVQSERDPRPAMRELDMQKHLIRREKLMRSMGITQAGRVA